MYSIEAPIWIRMLFICHSYSKLQIYFQQNGYDQWCNYSLYNLERIYWIMYLPFSAWSANMSIHQYLYDSSPITSICVNYIPDWGCFIFGRISTKLSSLTINNCKFPKPLDYIIKGPDSYIPISSTPCGRNLHNVMLLEPYSRNLI